MAVGRLAVGWPPRRGIVQNERHKPDLPRYHPAAMKTAIVTAVTNDAGGNLHRVQTACYLILTSSYYNVWH